MRLVYLTSRELWRLWHLVSRGWRRRRHRRRGWWWRRWPRSAVEALCWYVLGQVGLLGRSWILWFCARQGVDPWDQKNYRQDLVTKWERSVNVQRKRNAKLRRMPRAIGFRATASYHSPGRVVCLGRGGCRKGGADVLRREGRLAAAAFATAFARSSCAWDICPGHSVASHLRFLSGTTSRFMHNRCEGRAVFEGTLPWRPFFCAWFTKVSWPSQSNRVCSAFYSSWQGCLCSAFVFLRRFLS